MELIEKYAKLAVRKGVNVQKGQVLLINASIDTVEFTRRVVKEAYLAGAKEVLVTYRDDMLARYNYEYQDIETLQQVRNWQIDSRLDYFKEGACILHIISDLPNTLEGIDVEKIAARNKAFGAAMREVQDYTMLNKVQWSIVAVPNSLWAKEVFPKLEEAKAVQALWDAIYASSYVNAEVDALQTWEKRDSSFQKKTKIMNAHNFASLHFKNSLGTDVVVGLVDNHIWEGGSSVAQNGAVFFPNIPTEEIFSMPHKYKVDGVVVASKPLDYNGTLIKDFKITFKDGKAISCSAKENETSLQALIDFDKGSCYLGEIALVDHSSAISKSGILFYNTLFDENASCHMALGRAYPSNIQGGDVMDEETAEKHGMNNSLTHVDFMFGSGDMQVFGTTQEGIVFQVMKDGEFVLEE